MADPGYIVDGVLTDPEAWISLASTTLGSDTAVVTFTSPDDGSSKDWSQFNDLVLIIFAQCANTGYGNNTVRIRLNNDSSSSYDWQGLRGDGASVVAGQGNIGYMLTTRIPGAKTSGAVTQTAMFGGSITRFFDINGGQYKTLLVNGASEASNSGNFEINAFTWQNQDPIIEMDIEQAGAEDYITGSTFHLWGVLPRMVAP